MEGMKKVYNRYDLDAFHSSTVDLNKQIGLSFADRVRDEKLKHYIGEKIILNRKTDFRTGESHRTMGGCVIGIYPFFLLLDCGFYKTTVSYKDLVLGGKNES